MQNVELNLWNFMAQLVVDHLCIDIHEQTFLVLFDQVLVLNVINIFIHAHDQRNRTIKHRQQVLRKDTDNRMVPQKGMKECLEHHSILLVSLYYIDIVRRYLLLDISTIDISNNRLSIMVVIMFGLKN